MEQLVDVVVSALKESPSLALWVLAILYGFKVVVVGSIFGVVRLFINKCYAAYITPKHTLTVIDVEARLRSMVINDCHEGLIAQIERIKNSRRTGLGNSNSYIHASDVYWLKEAIDNKLELDEKSKKPSMTKV